MTKGGDRKSEHFSKRQNDALKKSEKTSKRIAKEFGVGYRTVERAEQFLDGLNAAEDNNETGDCSPVSLLAIQD